MVDFLKISIRSNKNNVEVYPTFNVWPKSKDLMIRGRDFYAVYNEETGLWSTDEDDALAMIDDALYKYAEDYKKMNI